MRKLLPAISCVAAAIALFATPVGAVIQRTFVASTGGDTNPCTLTQPCRSFAAAMVQTASGGDVVVLDSAGYGGVTITKSVNIVSPPGVYAGVTVTNGSAITVNAPGLVVSLKGLTINGAVQSGVNYVAGAQLTIEDCTISNFATGISAVNTGGVLNVRNTQVRNSSSYGLRLGGLAGAALNVHVDKVTVDVAGAFGVYLLDNVQASIVDSTIVNVVDRAVLVAPFTAFVSNTTTLALVRSVIADSSTGVEIVPGAANTTAEVSIRGSEIVRNAGDAVSIDTNDPTSIARLTLSDTSIVLNAGNGVNAQNTGLGTSQTVLTRNVITRNGGHGIQVGANANVRSAGDNRVDSNVGTAVSGTVTAFGGV